MSIPDAPTPPAMTGTWTLTAPDGRQWQAESPLKCCKAEMDERVPADVALARIMREASAPVESAALAQPQGEQQEKDPEDRPALRPSEIGMHWESGNG